MKCKDKFFPNADKILSFKNDSIYFNGDANKLSFKMIDISNLLVH